MKKLILAAALLTSSTGAMAVGEILDPWDYPTVHIQCEYPLEREDGAILLSTEIASVEFYVTGPDTILPVTWGTPHSINTVACETFIDISGYPDGQYYVTGTATDTDGRVSSFSVNDQLVTGAYAFEVQGYVKSPKSLTGITGTAIPRAQ